ncbi:MAG: ATP-binding protein [Gemmatimonadaceae bacterium]
MLNDYANAQYPRALYQRIAADLELYPVVAVMGARQVGKSTLCLQLARERVMAYRTLDERDFLDQARQDPAGFLDDLGDAGGFIDEAQRAPELFLAIKTVVDREQRAGRYLLSGSNQPAVTGSVSDSLLGRAAYRTLRPLTLSELRLTETHPGWSFLFAEKDSDVMEELGRRQAASGELDWRDVSSTGGFPRAVLAPPAQRLTVLNDYAEVFARRDIRDVLGIESTERFEAFLRLTAARTGQESNHSTMSRDLGIPVTTIRRWFDALIRSYLIELLEPYSRNPGNRVIKAPKVFMVDSAFALATARETTPTGFHLENMIASDLAVWRDEGAARGLYHWRLGSGQEVDFILEENGQLVSVEVKASSNVGRDEARHLRTFRSKYANTRRAVVLSCDPVVRTLGDGVLAAPWWAVV